MTEVSIFRRLATYGSVAGLLTALSLPLPSVALAQTANEQAVVDAVIGHPNVAAVRARICGAASRYNRARSASLPQVDFSVRTTRSLTTNVDRGTTLHSRTQEFDDGRDASGTDAVVGLDQTLFDWGLNDTDKQIAINDKAASTIAMRVEIDRVAADILDLALRVSEQRQRLAIQGDYQNELAPLVERIEASVRAGVLRIGDLRAIKILELDAEIARSLSERQVTLIESELLQRFGLNYDQAAVLLDRFLENRPDLPPQIDSATAREIRQLDIQLRTTSLEFQRLKAERYPQLVGNLDLTLFNADEFSSDYEVTGGLNMAVPFYDGGSNRARRAETEWRRRGLESERSNLIRQHGNVQTNTLQNIERAREQFDANSVKKIDVDFRLAEARARQGVTTNEPLEIARTLEQSFTIAADQVSLDHQIELGLLQGVFFSDQLGNVIELPYGGPPC